MYIDKLITSCFEKFYWVFDHYQRVFEYNANFFSKDMYSKSEQSVWKINKHINSIILSTKQVSFELIIDLVDSAFVK